MKHTTLTPPTLKIAIVSAILGLGAVSTANAQAKETFFPNMFNSKFNANSNKLALDSLYHNMILGKTAITPDEQYKFYADDGNEVPDSLFFNKLLHEQQLNGFKAGDKIIPLDENGKPVYTLETKVENGKTTQVYTVTTKTATAEDVAKSPYAHGIQKDIDDLYSFDQEVTDRIATLDRATEILTEAGNHHDELIRNLYEFSNHQEEYALRQTDEIENLIQASSANTDRISTAELGIAENKKDALIAKAQANENKDGIAKNQADIANNIDNIYELAQQQDQHSSDIKNLGKASLTNTKRITTAELGIAENKKDALIAKAQANQNKADITTNKADITKNKATLAQHTKKIDDNQRAIEAKLGGKVDAQKLVDLETKVDDGLKTVQENYSKLDTQVQSVDNKIGMVDTRVNALDDKVENSMAAQAALNGLFQPYNVGKVSVSVAVGAYGSKSAIAVGAGYRVNPHLAFKGGAAINTSGSRKGSYNLGINYEF